MGIPIGRDFRMFIGEVQIGVDIAVDAPACDEMQLIEWRLAHLTALVRAMSPPRLKRRTRDS